MSWRRITVNKSILGRLHNGDSIKCDKCKTAMSEGTEAWSHMANYGRRYFCLDCYKELWL